MSEIHAPGAAIQFGAAGGIPTRPSIEVVNSGGVIPSTGTTGAPTAGTWTAGQMAADSTGRYWMCTATGTPGTWELVSNAGAGGVTSFNTRSGAVALTKADVTGIGLAAADVGADASGAAAAAQTAAEAASVPLSALTAKGDLLVASGSGAVARIGVGADGDVLTADSTQTDGVKWAPGSGAYGGPTAGAAAAIEMYTYGHSFCVYPGQRCTQGAEFFNLMKTELGLLASTTYGVSGLRMMEDAFAAIGGAFVGVPAGALVSNPASGVFIVDCLENDYENPSTPKTVSPSALTDGQINGIVNSFSALMAVLSSSARTEEPASATNWSRNANSTPNYVLSGGFCLSTVTAGATFSQTVDVPSSGKLWALTYPSDPTVAPNAGGTWTVGGTTVGTFNPLGSNGAAQFSGINSNTSGGPNTAYTLGPVVTPLSGMPSGSQTITFTADNSGHTFTHDCFLTPSATPPAIFVLLDPDPLSTGSAPIFDPAQIAIISANKTLLDTAITAAAAAFPNVTVVTVSQLGLTTSGQSSVDGLHPNDRGMRQYAKSLSSLMLSTLNGDSNSLYQTL